MLLEEGKRKKIELPSYLKRWVDLSRVFPTKLFPTEKDQKPYEFDRRDPKERQAVISDLSQMVKLAGIQWQGRPSLAITEVHNIEGCVNSMI